MSFRYLYFGIEVSLIAALSHDSISFRHAPWADGHYAINISKKVCGVKSHKTAAKGDMSKIRKHRFSKIGIDTVLKIVNPYSSFFAK